MNSQFTTDNDQPVNGWFMCDSIKTENAILLLHGF